MLLMYDSTSGLIIGMLAHMGYHSRRLPWGIAREGYHMSDAMGGGVAVNPHDGG